MRGLRISWLTVGIKPSFCFSNSASKALSGRFRAKAPYANSGTNRIFTVLPEQKAEETDTRFMHAGNVFARKTNPV
jgi:hypothetical protein